MQIMGDKNRRSGYFAEFLARCWYRCHGWRIVVKNYKTGKCHAAGEVDFIAKKGKSLAFVEVKKRKTTDLAAYAITKKQEKRIVNAARFFLRTKPEYADFDIRFDALLISFPLSFRRITAAWTEDFQ